MFDKEVECFSIRLEKLLTEAGGTLTIEECFAAFPEINESEFIMLLSAFQKNRNNVFYRDKELISVSKL